MKTVLVMAAVTACLAGLAGCVTPQTYDEIHVRGWTRDRVDQQFPPGVSKKQVFEKLGNPVSESSAGGLTRWDYADGASGQRHVALYFRNDTLVEKRFDNNL
jgi:outer membrane protein assembly factor BamE (lipoprotein component of BamABCDE complex)